MFGFLPVTNYQSGQIKKYLAYGSIAIISIFLIGNIATAIFRDSIKINTDNYSLKDGFPIFKSEKEYIKFVKNYPYNMGTGIIFHTVKQGESYWDIAQRYNITIDTLLAANPFITSLLAKKETKLVIPAENGVLMTFDDILDVRRMSKILDYKDEILGDYRPTIFKIISTDDMRLVFFKETKPEILNNSIDKLYTLRKAFQSPLRGNFTSLFGNRVDPFRHKIAFHDGLDILAKFGTPVRPAREGMVFFTGWRDGYGKTIVIQHHDGYTTIYGHLSKINIEKGDWITKDDTIGFVGSTGRSTGAHLHFVLMRHGEILNPMMVVW